MTPCHVVEIVTPKKFLLRGLWFGPKRARRVFIFIHGLGGSVFSMQALLGKLVDKNTAVLSFNNRGFEVITRRRTLKKGRKNMLAGAAHEVFTECVDDIQGAVKCARKRGGKEMYLVGHSTGCQKAVYWAYKKGRGVRGIVLLAPVSDWAAETKRQGKKKVSRALATARSLVRRGKKHALLPENVWHETLDAQRFVSLYDPNSVEEIFSYAQQKEPKILRSIQKPILIFWAGKDEFAKGESPKQILEWFLTHVRKGVFSIQSNANHGFKGAERTVVETIQGWVKNL